MRILVVDDNKGTAEFIKDALSDEGYAVDIAYSGDEGEILAESIPYDLIILDVILPGKNGIEVCRSLRRKNIRVPVMLLSGIRKDDQDIIQGLDHGADEYLLKNVKLEVLLARVRALLRKEQATKNPKLNIGPIVLNTVYRQVWLEQREVQLTAKEYSILEYLAYHPNIVITRTKIEQHVWNLEFDISSNVVDEHIMNLRKKLGSVLTIETVRGVGYRLKV